jgi:hypothetical protein
MPQFDKFTFAPQLCWVFILFLLLYVYFLRISLPTIATTLKLRSKKLSKSTGSSVLGLNKKENSSGLYLQELVSIDLGGTEPGLLHFSPIKKRAFLRSSTDSIRKSLSKYTSLF